MSGLFGDGFGMTEAERALGKIVWICEQADKDPEPLWVQYGPEIEAVARTYFLDQLSRESHEFEGPSS